MNSYQEFLESKVVTAPKTGIKISPAEVNPVLKPHQRDAVLWAAMGGRRALFEAFGGLMTVPLVALQKHRQGIGIELNPDYFRDGCGYLQIEEQKQETPTLFDFL